VTSAHGGARQPPLSASTARQICRSGSDPNAHTECRHTTAAERAISAHMRWGSLCARNAGSGAIGTAVGRVVMCGRSASQSAAVSVPSRRRAGTGDPSDSRRRVASPRNRSSSGRRVCRPCVAGPGPLRSGGRPTQRHTVDLSGITRRGVFTCCVASLSSERSGDRSQGGEREETDRDLSHMSLCRLVIVQIGFSSVE
jgi:hypothetical protein